MSPTMRLIVLWCAAGPSYITHNPYLTIFYDLYLVPWGLIIAGSKVHNGSIASSRAGGVGMAGDGWG